MSIVREAPAEKNVTERTSHQHKGELNLDDKWQSDDLFYIIINEIHPRSLVSTNFE